MSAPFVELAIALGWESLTARVSVWALGWGERGFQIERMLGGNFLPDFFPTIDKVSKSGDVVTSIKSIDLRGSTYQNVARLTKKIEGYVEKLKAFKTTTWRGETVVVNGNTVRVLQVAVPKGAMTAAQRQALVEAVQKAGGKGVILQIVEIY